MTDALSRRRWAEREMEVLIEELGDDGPDAERVVTDALAHVPEGEDPATYLPPYDPADAEVTDADVADARADWYVNEAVPDEFKRILDAREE